jgi:hypothetical protein
MPSRATKMRHSSAPLGLPCRLPSLSLPMAAGQRAKATRHKKPPCNGRCSALRWSAHVPGGAARTCRAAR